MNLRPSSKIHLVIIFLYTSNRISLTWMWIRSVLEVFILVECWLQSGHGLLLFLFITSLLRWGGLIWLLLSAVVKAIFWMHSSFHVELPSCHSLLMSLVLFQENITNSHRCLTDWKSLNNVRLYSLSVNLKWQRTIRNKNNTFFYSLWKCLNDCNSEVKGIWVFHSYSRFDVLTNGLMLQ